MVAPTPSDTGGDRPAETVDRPRRGFLLKLVALGIGALACAVPAAAGLIAMLNPLRQKGQGAEPFKLATLETLDAVPRKFPVVADRTDAWNRFPNEPIGAVYLRRLDDGQVQAIHVVCPHAGCSVQYDVSGNQYFCPCHEGHFDLSGKRLDETPPSPRDLDTLPVEIRNGNEVWVQFVNYRTGVPEKVIEA